ncbi:MAG TPA: UV damage endonuclease UvsE [Roseiflexaceae bacterium]|nr:UV damage endonuclease UvsE [Roseiflexaceae bacterium]
MIRLGVSVNVLGRPGRRGPAGAGGAHPSVRLLELRELLLYLAGQGICYYRPAGDLLPLDGAAEALAECGDLPGEVGALARRLGMRLTLHPPLHAALSAPDTEVAGRAAAQLAGQAALLDALGCGPEAVLVLHVGGAYGDAPAALERFAARYERLPAPLRQRLAVEQDEYCFDLCALLRLHQLTGVPLVFDSLHFQLHNPARLGLAEALGLALATWPRGVPAEVHFSSQRTEGHARTERGGAVRVAPPRHGQHADFANPFEFAALLRAARGLPPFDIMLEAKAGDLAVLRLRDDLRRFAPEEMRHS